MGLARRCRLAGPRAGAHRLTARGSQPAISPVAEGGRSGADAPGVLMVTTRSWPSLGGIQQDVAWTARGMAEERPVRVGALLATDREMTRRLQFTEVPTWEPIDGGGYQVRPFPMTALERACLLPLAFWRGRVPGALHQRARAFSAPVYAAAVAPAIERLAQGMSLIHLFGSDMIGFAALRAARRLRIPLVITPYTHAGWWGDDILNQRLFREADAVLALLESEADDYRAWGVPAERLHVTGVFRMPGEAGEMPVSLPAGHPVVAFIGVKRFYKGIDVMRAAAPAVWERYPDTMFVLAGPGDDAPPAQADPRLIELGWISDAQKFALLDRADILCLPSRSEILPGVILEAWERGKPVVTSDIPNLKSLVGDGGIACPPDPASLAAALVSLIGDPDRRRILGAWGRDRVAQTYNRDAYLARLRTIYDTVLAGGGQARSGPR